MSIVRKIWLIVLLFSAVFVQAQTNVFVSASAADDSGNGQSWETAKRTLAGALAVAGINTHIYVMVGLYAETSELTIPSGVTVTGGYATNSTGVDTTQRLYPSNNSQWSDVSHSTILDGGMAHRVATVSAGGTLSGCVVQHGKTSENGGGLLVNGGTVSHCVILYCMAYNENESTPSKGGGVYVQNNGVLLNSVICYNRAENGYGAAAASGNIVNNTITQNYGLDCGTVTDYDNNEYQTVLIGGKCWMRENLRVTHFANGTAISNDLTLTTSEPRYYNVGTSSSETEIYGLLYNVAAARQGTADQYSENIPSGIQGVCPTGWHLPSNAEFEQMIAALAADDAYLCGTVTANVAKALASTEYWQSTNATCAVGNMLVNNNLSLFNARPAGAYDGAFSGLYTQCYFWTTSQNNGTSSQCVYRQLSYNNPTLQYNYTTSEKGYSVRCVKN